MRMTNIQQDPHTDGFAEWVFYDGKCTICTDWLRRMGKTLNARDFGIASLQTGWVQPKIVHIDDPLKEMLMLTADGRIIGGADAVIYIARRIWWMYWFYAISFFPGMKWIMRRVYRLVAENRYCVSSSCWVTT